MQVGVCVRGTRFDGFETEADQIYLERKPSSKKKKKYTIF